MADEEVIILEEEEEEEQGESSESADDEAKKKKKKLILFGAIGGGVLLIIIILVVVLLMMGGDEEVPEVKEDLTDKITEKLLTDKVKTMAMPELEQMIKKANLFYARGDKQEALSLFGKISSYSEAISSYNLGVAQMEEGNCDEAIKSFQKAIDIGEDRCLSAINAAVCSFRLERPDEFAYYIDLAEAYLPDDGNEPLYSYQYALVNYYKRHYFEALSPLLHRTSDYYTEEVNHLLAKIFLLFNDDYNAITYLEKSQSPGDGLAMGLLYARIGEYDIASNYIINHIESGHDGIMPRMALALIDIKQGNFGDTAKNLDSLIKRYEDEAVKYYPIRVKLKDTLFDINEAQARFKKEFISPEVASKIIFYFAPYKVFNAKEALAFIKKGGMNIFIDEIQDAQNALLQGSTISKVNLNIAHAISKALDHKIRDANAYLKRVVNDYPNHSVLHYNLGLSYAQLGEFDKAYRHFLRGYHLDNRDVMSGIFAVMCAKIIHKDYGRIMDGITEDLDHFGGSEAEQEFLLTLVTFFQSGNPTSAVQWYESEKPRKPIYLAFENLIAHYLQDYEGYRQKATELKQLLKNDVVAGVFYEIAHHGNKSVKDFAFYTQNFFKTEKLDMTSIYYGPSIARELYIKMGYIAGTLHYVKEKLHDRMLAESYDSRGILQAMGMSYIYTREFEKAFVIYNKLIDEMKVKDAHTLFLAAVSAIGSDHHENAIALLELSRLTDMTNFESRMALGLLYQEAKNLKSAAIHYSAIGNTGFESDYFDYLIDTQNTQKLN